MKKVVLAVSLLVVILLILGCTQPDTQKNTQELKCPTLDYSNCPQTKCPELNCASCQTQSCQAQVKTITKYQCFDGTIIDSNNCPLVNNPSQTNTLKEFSGSNGAVTAQFYLKPGLAIFYAKDTGKSNFIVDLLDKDGGSELLLNVIGPYNGSFSATIETEGYYRLEIDHGAYSTGTWEIAVEQ